MWFPWTLKVYHEAIERSDRPAFLARKAVCVFRTKLAWTLVAQEKPATTEKFQDYLASGDEWRW